VKDENPEKRFIIRKRVMARTCAEALAKEPTTPVEDVFVDSEQPPKASADAIGFKPLPGEDGRREE
jgi:hypothetical protein